MIENVKKTFFKSKMRKPLAVLLSMAMIFTMFPMTAMAAASDTVKIQITDSEGKTATLATWTYDSVNETYTDNATNQELSIVKDFTAEENLKGTVNGKAYDFSDLGALVYTGSNMKPDCRAIAVTTKGILIDDVYNYAGDLLDASKGKEILKSDNVKMSVSQDKGSGIYTYNNYWGQTKYYYPKWYADDAGAGNKGIVSEEDQADCRVVPTTLAIEGRHELAGFSVSDLIKTADTENALRAMIGQQQGGISNDVDQNLGENSVKNIKLIKFTLDKTFADAGLNDVTIDPDEPDKPVGPDPVDPGTDDYDWESLTWAGGLDFSWYDENDVKSEYHITTPAQWEALAWICSEDLGKLADFKTNTNGNVTAIKGTVPTAKNEFAGVQFYLDNDIDMGGVKAADGTWSGPNYYPIGSEGRNDLDDGYFYGVFCGSVNGQGHIVKNVYCERNSDQDTGHGSSSSIGLFGRVGSPDKTDYTDNNITIENIAVSGYIRGYRSTGGVIGKTLHVASGKVLTVKNCLNFADIVTNGGSKGTGGVIGAAWNGAIVEKCANFGNVTAGYSGADAAGVSGNNESVLSDSYNVGTVSNTAKAENVGAVVCNNKDKNVNVTNCYALEGSAPGYTESIVNSKTLISGGWKTASEMKTADFAKLLSGSTENAWRLIGNGYVAVSSYIAELAGEYPVPAPFLKATSTPVEPGGGGSGGGGGSSSGGGGSTGPDTSGLDLKSRSWDGKTVDVSWYFGNESDRSYTISTAAELAGAAALVNGLVNSDCVVYTGSEVITAKNWNNNSKYVNTNTGEPGQNNEATDTYHYGIESFKDKTLYLSANLDMSGGNYMPVGGQYLMKSEDTSTKIGASFCGMFDGGGHTVNIECDRYCKKNYGDGESIGLIGRLGVHDKDDSSLRPSGAGVCDVAVTGSVKGNRSVGGVVGKIGQTSGTAVIERCANKADITGTDAKGTGGICGSAWNNGIIRDCYNSGKIVNTHNSYGGIAGSSEIKLINYYNSGKVSGNGKSAAVATSNGGDSYENCYWLKGTADMGVYDKSSISGVTEMSDADMKTETFVSKLGSAFAYRSGEYPVLKWEGGSSSGGAAGGAVTDPTQPTTPQDPATASGYSDVASNAWYSEAVKYVTDKNLMNGTGSGKFSPNASTTRGMIMTILARMSGTDTTGSSPWYKKGLDWVVSKNISDGTKPEATMTREQLATMLYRYSSMMGYDTTQGGMAVREYDDFGKISSYAAEAMAWAVNNQIITGVTKTELQPQGSATRAQIATILMRWSKLNEKAQ